MATLNVNLSDQAKLAAERRAVEIGFHSVQDYIADLVEQDEAVNKELEQLLIRRATGADAGEMRASDFDAIRSRVRAAAQGCDK